MLFLVLELPALPNTSECGSNICKELSVYVCPCAHARTGQSSKANAKAKIRMPNANAIACNLQLTIDSYLGTQISRLIVVRVWKQVMTSYLKFKVNQTNPLQAEIQ